MCLCMEKAFILGINEQILLLGMLFNYPPRGCLTNGKRRLRTGGCSDMFVKFLKCRLRTGGCSLDTPISRTAKKSQKFSAPAAPVGEKIMPFLFLMAQNARKPHFLHKNYTKIFETHGEMEQATHLSSPDPCCYHSM